MSIGTVSAYQQMQNWSATQASVTGQVLGKGSTAIDNSAAFTNITANDFGARTSLAGQAALGRIQGQFTATQAARSGSGPSTNDPGLAAAKAAGAAILNNLGLGGGSSGPSAPPSSASPYTAPTNPSTGYSYVQTSAGNFGLLGSLNLFA
jgi:hypothetical protein